MIFVLAPTVLQRLVLLRVSINTRVMASVPWSESRMRTL